MKKHLLTLAAVAALTPAFNANAEATLTEVWKYQGHELNADWDGTAPNWNSSDAIKSMSCTRFATGRDGRMYTVNMKTMSIAEITKDGMKDLYKLPPLEGEDYYGTAISMDEAGNFLIGHYFTKGELSSNVWTIYSPQDGKYQHIDLGYPDNMKPEEYVSPEDYGGGTGIGRIDCVGRIVGDLTKEGLFFIAPFGFGGSKESGGNTANNIRIIYAYGDGDAETAGLDGSEYLCTYLGVSSAQNIVQPSITNMDEFGNTTEDHYKAYILCSTAGGTWDIIDSYYNAPQKTACVAMQKTLRALPYRAQNNGFDSFVLGGRRYFVHSYINSDGAATNNQRPMDIAVFNEAGAIVATWQNIEYASNNGYNSIVAQPLEDGSAYIHLFTSCSSMTIGDLQGCGAAAVLKFTPESAEDMEGSEKNPIHVSTAEEFLALGSKCLTGTSYVVLDNNIDFAGKPYTVVFSEATIAGKTIHFDGQNHVLSNINVSEGNASVFGSYIGSIKNLGVENINASKNWFCVGGLVGNTMGDTEISNCYVTGSVLGAAAGGLVGAANAGSLTIVNCYSQADVTDTTGNHVAGLVGRTDVNVNISYAYASGSVTTTTGYAAGLVVAKNAEAKITLNNVIAWNASVSATGEGGSAVATVNGGVANETNVLVFDGMKINDAAVENGTDAATLLSTATAWEAYGEKAVNGMPVLAWQGDGPVAEIQDGTAEHPYQISNAEELGNIWALMVQGKQTYFVQTEDIDLTDVTEWTAFNGFNGTYDRAIHYDGQGHVIKNFHVEGRNALTSPNGYYSATIFGVLQGTVKNLGIVDADVKAIGLEGGIIGGFVGGSWVEGVPTVLDNVFITGKSSGSADVATIGGMSGVSAANVTMTNCYAQVEVITEKADAVVAGLAANIGDNTLTMTNCYVSAKVTGATDYNLIANGKNVVAENVYAFGEGKVPEGVSLVAPGDRTAIAAIKTWEAFNKGLDRNGLPALNWEDGSSAIYDVEIEDTDAPAVYYNLQGVQVANPENGIYIVRRGNKVTKEIIR